jgi:hypothetical protein
MRGNRGGGAGAGKSLVEGGWPERAERSSGRAVSGGHLDIRLVAGCNLPCAASRPTQHSRPRRCFFPPSRPTPREEAGTGPRCRVPRRLPTPPLPSARLPPLPSPPANPSSAPPPPPPPRRTATRPPSRARPPSSPRSPRPSSSSAPTRAWSPRSTGCPRAPTPSRPSLGWRSPCNETTVYYHFCIATRCGPGLRELTI